MNSSQNDSEYKNDLFEIFLDRLVSLYINKEHDKIKKILIGSNEQKTYRVVSENGNGTKYIDENTVIPVRVWTDSETRSYLETLYCICKDKNMMISLNNKMIELWLYEMNNEMSRFFFRSKDTDCSRDSRITIEIEKEKWDEFTERVKVFKAKVPEGFKDCVNKFLRQKAKINL